MGYVDKSLIGEIVVRSKDKMEFIVWDVYTKHGLIKVDMFNIEHDKLILTVTDTELVENFEEF